MGGEIWQGMLVAFRLSYLNLGKEYEEDCIHIS